MSWLELDGARAYLLSFEDALTHSEKSKLLQPAPAGRDKDSLWRHFECERAIAQRLRAADREARRMIYQTMYKELFAAVPDHPRLTRRSDAAMTARVNRGKTSLLQPFIRDDAVFLEFGAGDCRFALAMAQRFQQVHAVDIANQVGEDVLLPGNFSLSVYDGYGLDLADGIIDVAFSDQLIEHLHPDDVVDHFKLAHRLLKPGGVYLLRTPHRLTGPHDVSRYFSVQAECFHLKEWTYGELVPLVRDLGYRSVMAYWAGKGIRLRQPLFIFSLIESVFNHAPLSFRRNWLPFMLPSVVIAATK